MPITNGYATLAELRARVQETTGVTTDDTIYEQCVEAASRLIDQFCGRRFWKDPADTTRTFAADDDTHVEIDDLVTLTTLKTDETGDGTFETTWTTADYELGPVNSAAYAETHPYSHITAIDTKAFPTAASGRRFLVQVVGIFGWNAVPDAVNESCLLTAARLVKRRSSPEGVAGFGQFGEVRVSSRMDPDAAMLLQPYQRVTLSPVRGS